MSRSSLLSHLSRREFLKSSGIALLAGAANHLPLVLPPQEIDFVYGRALAALPVYHSPSLAVASKKYLWPDSVVPIVDTMSGWYRLDDGYAKTSGIQPMVLPTETTSTPPLPFWAEVGGAVAAVRRWCAADAPLIARIGHGGVAQVVDQLSGNYEQWYALVGDEGFLGWSPSAPWKPLDESMPDAITGEVYVSTSVGQLEFVDNERTVLRAPVSFGTSLTPGTYTVRQRKRSVIFQMENTSDGYGVPWSMDFGSYSLAGAYWHNEFGAQKGTPGSSVQVTPPVARWLYDRLPEGAPIMVR
jgi:hypothetical protein